MHGICRLYAALALPHTCFKFAPCVFPVRCQHYGAFGCYRRSCHDQKDRRAAALVFWTSTSTSKVTHAATGAPHHLLFALELWVIPLMHRIFKNVNKLCTFQTSLVQIAPFLLADAFSTCLLAYYSSKVDRMSSCFWRTCITSNRGKIKVASLHLDANVLQRTYEGGPRSPFLHLYGWIRTKSHKNAHWDPIQIHLHWLEEWKLG